MQTAPLQTTDQSDQRILSRDYFQPVKCKDPRARGSLSAYLRNDSARDLMLEISLAA